MESDDSWETASIESIKYTKAEIKRQKSVKEAKFIILHKILAVVDSLRNQHRFIIATGVNDYEKIEKINNISNFDDAKQQFPGFYDRNGSISIHTTEISRFLSLNFSDIPARIYFVISHEMDDIVFLEYKINNTFIKHIKKYKGNCFSVDFHGALENQSIVFSKNHSHHQIFNKVIDNIKEHRIMSEITPVEIFKELDSSRINVVPTNLNKMKVHPLYTIDDLCSANETVFPKRPICGYFKGKPVYPSTNIVKLKTEKSWYYNGRTLKNIEQQLETEQNKPIKPYRIVKDKQLYAEFQTEPITIPKITGEVMDAFHPNFTPKGCVYLTCNSYVAKCLNIRYAECITGFRHKEKIQRGIFVKKEDCFIVNYFTKEYEYHKEVENKIKEYEEIHKNIKDFMQKLEKYSKIKKRIG